MEDAKQAKVVGIAENILIELHHGLLVATKEVDLDASDAVLLHPFHLLATDTAVVHLTDRSLRSIVPSTIGIVPQEEGHPFVLA